MVATAVLIKDGSGEVQINRSLVELIESMPEGKYRIIIEPQAQMHSVPQRKLFFMWLSYLSRETGNSKTALYRYYCKRFLTEDMPSVSQMSNLQLSQFMLEVQSDVASELGISLPVPEDGDEFVAFITEFKYR